MQDDSIPDSDLNASSSWSYNKAADARLKSSGAWIAYYNSGMWLQVALNSVTNITAIATQGSSTRYFWTKLYRLRGRLDRNVWQPYRKVRGIFQGIFQGYCRALQALPLTKANARSANNMRDQQTGHRKPRVVAMVM